MTARLRTVVGVLTVIALAGCGGGTGSPASGSWPPRCGSAAAAAGLGEAMLENTAGSFLLPTHDTVTAALYTDEQLVPSDLRQSLVDAGGGNSYPIVNYEYLMVHLSQPSAVKALAIRTMLSWLVDPTRGSSPAYLSPVNFVALPGGVLTKVQAAIPKISS